MKWHDTDLIIYQNKKPVSPKDIKMSPFFSPHVVYVAWKKKIQREEEGYNNTVYYYQEYRDFLKRNRSWGFKNSTAYHSSVGVFLFYKV